MIALPSVHYCCIDETEASFAANVAVTVLLWELLFFCRLVKT
jgi:hypothetical protein